MKKMRQEAENVMQSADADPMTAMSKLGSEAGGFQSSLQQCGVDTTSMMNDLKPKIGDYLLRVKSSISLNFNPDIPEKSRYSGYSGKIRKFRKKLHH